MRYSIGWRIRPASHLPSHSATLFDNSITILAHHARYSPHFPSNRPYLDGQDRSLYRLRRDSLCKARSRRNSLCRRITWTGWMGWHYLEGLGTVRSE